MSMNIRPPGELNLCDIDITGLNLWLDAFEDYIELAQPSIDESKKRMLFLTVAGLEVRKLASGLTILDSGYQSLVDALRKHVQPVKSVVVARHKFFSRTQGVSEDVASFVAHLKQLCYACDFNDTSIDSVENQLVRDVFVKGLANEKIAESLLKESNLSLIKSVDIAQAMEQAALDIKNLQQGSNQNVMAIQNRREKPNYSNNSKDNNRRKIVCYACGGEGHIAKECPSAKPKPKQCKTCNREGHISSDCFRNATCTNCGKKGHTAKVCRQGGTRNPDQDGVYALEVDSSSLPYVDVLFNKNKGRFLIDTGSSITILSKTFVHSNGMKEQLKPLLMNATVADGGNMSINQQINGCLTVDGVEIKRNFAVTELPVSGILGMDVLRKVGLLVEKGNSLIMSIVPSVVKKYNHIFDKPLDTAVLKNIEPQPIIQLDSEIPKQAPNYKMRTGDETFLEGGNS